MKRVSMCEFVNCKQQHAIKPKHFFFKNKDIIQKICFELMEEYYTTDLDMYEGIRTYRKMFLSLFSSCKEFYDMFLEINNILENFVLNIIKCARQYCNSKEKIYDDWASSKDLPPYKQTVYKLEVVLEPTQLLSKGDLYKQIKQQVDPIIEMHRKTWVYIQILESLTLMRIYYHSTDKI